MGKPSAGGSSRQKLSRLHVEEGLIGLGGGYTGETAVLSMKGNSPHISTILGRTSGTEGFKNLVRSRDHLPRKRGVLQVLKNAGEPDPAYSVKLLPMRKTFLDQETIAQRVCGHGMDRVSHLVGTNSRNENFHPGSSQPNALAKEKNGKLERVLHLPKP